MTKKDNDVAKIRARREQRGDIMHRGGSGSINLEERGQPLVQPRELDPDAMTGRGDIGRKMGLLQEIARQTGLDLREAATRYEGLDEGQLQDVLRQLGY